MNKKLLLIVAFGLFPILLFGESFLKDSNQGKNERQYWCDLLYKMTEPVLSNMSKGQLKQNMLLELSPSWDGRNKDVAYMECFGRTMAGLAPWLSLPDDNTVEGKQRKQLREWALKSYAHAVNPDSPDYLGWKAHGQALVDAAYIAESFLRAPSLWKALDKQTQERYIKEFQGLRRFTPVYSNWLLFVATIESFLKQVPTKLIVETLEPVVLYMFPRDMLFKLAKENWEINMFYQKILEYSLIVSQIKADSWRFESARERYNLLLETHPEIIKRAPLAHIASYLLMTPETLSRVRSGVL